MEFPEIPFPSSILSVVVVAILAIEAAFYFIFHYYLIPRANKITEPAEFRDYGRDRHKLVLRIIQRMEDVCAASGDCLRTAVLRLFADYFHPHDGLPVPGLDESLSSSPETSDDESSRDSSGDLKLTFRTLEDKLLPVPYRQEVNDFFSWAFFGKKTSRLEEWEQEELQLIFDIVADRCNVEFPMRDESSDLPYPKPRLMTLEPLKAIHRPFFVYVMVMFARLCGAVLLFTFGFRRYVSSSGLVSWYRPARNPNQELHTTLFFHGIAPGGTTFYLPMVLLGLFFEKDRPVFLFENPSISCNMDFRAMTEATTVDGVIEALQHFKSDKKSLSLVGHSFGSCPCTWLLRSGKLQNIKQVTLLDPVTILLHNPDVVVNFIYAEEISKIRMVASSELFTEYYIRRHFSWYNSELWLDDVPKDCQVLVCLAEKDEIIDANKVRFEVERHQRDNQGLIFWKGIGHAGCVTSPTKWRQIKTEMLRQELLVAQSSS